MKRLLLIIFFALSVLVIVKAKEEAVPGEFPWTVSLELDPQQGYFGHDCGGAILNEVTKIISPAFFKKVLFYLCIIFISELDYYYWILWTTKR